MSVSESIIEWLQTFEPAEYWKMNNIDTDMQSTNVDTYSLVKQPVQIIKAYMSNKKLYTEHYTIQARLSNQTDTDRVKNNSYGEALEEWVREQKNNGSYPMIAQARVMDIHITTPFYLGKAETNSSIYQMTIAIKYEKEN